MIVGPLSRSRRFEAFYEGALARVPGSMICSSMARMALPQIKART